MQTNLKNHTLLLVDDEPDILEFLSYNLKKEGYKVYTASNGEEGVALTQQISPSLILLDVMMPKMDGIETCQIIRKDLNIDQPIIAFLTSRAEDYSQIAGFEASPPRWQVVSLDGVLRPMTSAS
jgi:two-component system alkaline phosphatase synthesis response regulator PhoP